MVNIAEKQKVVLVRYKNFLGQESSSLIVIVLIVLTFRHAAILFSDLMISKFSNRNTSTCCLNYIKSLIQK